MSAAVAVQKAQEVPQPAAEAMEVGESAAGSAGGSGEDLYSRLKTLQRQLEFVEIQVRARPIARQQPALLAWPQRHPQPPPAAKAA